METNRCPRFRGVVSSLLVVIASFCAASMTHAAPRPSMKELLATQELQRPKAPSPFRCASPPSPSPRRRDTKATSTIAGIPATPSGIPMTRSSPMGLPIT